MGFNGGKISEIGVLLGMLLLIVGFLFCVEPVKEIEMSYQKDMALDSIRRVHAQVDNLEDVPADLKELETLIDELVQGIREDIFRRDQLNSE